jgi:hypothetical protein
VNKDLEEWKNNSLILVKEVLQLNISTMQKLEQNEIRTTIQFGLNIRIIIIQENIIGIYEALKSEDSPKLTMNINSFYIHIKGILDNLAVIIDKKYEMNIHFMSIDLRKNKFKKALKNININLYQVLDDYSEWLDEIKNKRDPIAHKKPLYVPPGIINSKEEQDKCDDINRKIELEKDVNKIIELMHEWGNIAGFHPYMIQHDETTLEHIEETVLKDLKMLKELNVKTFKICQL